MQQELTAKSILSLFQTDKAQRQTFVDKVIESLNDGITNPLNVHLQVKCMEDIVKKLSSNDSYKEAVLDIVEKNGKKFMYQNAEFSIKEAGTKYDYSICNDPELIQMYAEQKALDEKIKAKEKLLQALPLSGTEMLFGDELIKVYPPNKTSTTAVFVSLK